MHKAEKKKKAKNILIFDSDTCNIIFTKLLPPSDNVDKHSTMRITAITIL